MCGLAGFLWSHDGDSKDISGQLKLMTDAIRHRGPDDEGFWSDLESKVAFGHRRLSALDLSLAGHQPMRSLSGRFVIAFNGEIYNHLDLRLELEKGLKQIISWNGSTDTETLLYCFELWGIDTTLTKLVGMFAIALYDTQKNSLYLIRDRMGEKPLYYGWISNNFVFGSELKSIKTFKGFPAEVNRDALALYLKYDYVPSPYSIYKGINKLSQGSYLKLTMGANGWNRNSNIDITNYWSMSDIAKSGKMKNKYIGSEEEAIERLDNLLSKKIKEQMIADVPLGAFLSGGIDSSLIVALMQKQSNRKVKTFTIGFSEKNYNEAEYAKEVAIHLGTDHEELYITPKEAMGVISKLPKIYDEPFADSSQIPTFLVSEMARKHVTVSLSGDGGDELFGGYNRYFMAHSLWKKFEKVPLIVRNSIAFIMILISPRIWNYCMNFIFKFLPKSYRLSNPADKIYKLSRMLKANNISEVYDVLVSHWENPTKAVLNSSIKTAKKEKNNSFLRPVDQMMYKDSVTYLPDDILVKVDRASMAVSLETRAPFLDKDIVEFAWKLPFTMKIKGSTGKWVLRKILDKYVPNELINRPKMGFGVPIDAWLRGPLNEWAENLLSEKRLLDDGYFNVDLIRQKWYEHLSGEQNWQYHLWSVLMFQIWLDEERNYD